MVPLIENIKFCKIATQIQDVLAITPLPRIEDRTVLDSQLIEWFDNLPWILRSTDPCPEALYTARCIMKWRYQNLRLVLHRPVLLNLANRGGQNMPSPSELASVEKCRAIAKQTIEDISREWTRNQINGWNAVWFLYQACMIPLVSIFWENWNPGQIREWEGQVEMVIDLMAAMSDWSLAARRSREVVCKMYEASKRPPTRVSSPRMTPVGSSNGSNGHLNGNGVTNGNMQDTNSMTNGHMNGVTQRFQHITDLKDETDHDEDMTMMMEEGMVLLGSQSIWDLDGMLWGNLPENLDMPFDGVPEMDFEDVGQGGYDGTYMMHQ